MGTTSYRLPLSPTWTALETRLRARLPRTTSKDCSPSPTFRPPSKSPQDWPRRQLPWWTRLALQPWEPTEPAPPHRHLPGRSHQQHQGVPGQVPALSVKLPTWMDVVSLGLVLQKSSYAYLCSLLACRSNA